MKFALIFKEPASEFAKRSSEEAPEYWGSWSAYIDLLAENNVLVPGAGAGLQEPSTATIISHSDGKFLIQDSPSADTKEQLGGFVIIDVASKEEAIRWGEKAPCAVNGSVEVRPTMPDPS